MLHADVPMPTAGAEDEPLPEVQADCVRCRVPLVLHQPDIDDPYTFLGICPRCRWRRWHLVEVEPTSGDVLIVVIRRKIVHRHAAHTHPAPITPGSHPSGPRTAAPRSPRAR